MKLEGFKDLIGLGLIRSTSCSNNKKAGFLQLLGRIIKEDFLMLTNVFKKLVNAALIAALALTLGFALLTPAAAQAASGNSDCVINTSKKFAACYDAPIKSINKTNKTFVVNVVIGFDKKTKKILRADVVVRVTAKTKLLGVSSFNALKVGDEVTIATTEKRTDGSVVADSVTKN
jgi:hypothetical protein